MDMHKPNAHVCATTHVSGSEVNKGPCLSLVDCESLRRRVRAATTTVIKV